MTIRRQSYDAMDALRRYVAQAPNLTYDELWAMVQVELDMDAHETKIVRKSVESMLDMGLLYPDGHVANHQ